VALLVAGSWGVGEVDRTARELAESGVAVPVVVCGRNEALRAWLARQNLGVPLGWVEPIADLMRASDVLIQNAGGLTSVEAFAVGLPVVSYRCLAGHGRTNAEAMAEAGVAVHACDRGLADVLAQLDPLACARLTRRASGLFATDPADLIDGYLSQPPISVTAGTSRSYRRPFAVLAAALTAAVLACGLAIPAHDQARIGRLVHSVVHDVTGRSGTVKTPARPVRRKKRAEPVVGQRISERVVTA
jgi:hypothetical protein